jgi:hypothetical protein
MHRRSDTTSRRARGFTLLEIILAMFVLVMLVTAIFSIVGGTTQLADEMELAHERDARVHSFAQFCERTLRNLPGNAQVRMRVKQIGGRYLGELALKNAPSPIGASGANGMTILRTEQAPDGYLRVVLEMLTEEESNAMELGKGDAVKQRLVLLENVANCEWKFYNPLSLEWESQWNENLSFGPMGAMGLSPPAAPPQSGAAPNAPPPLTQVGAGALGLFPGARRPGLVELKFSIGVDAPRRFVFWVPPATQPGGAGGAPPPAPADPNAAPNTPPTTAPPGTVPPPAPLPLRR